MTTHDIELPPLPPLHIAPSVEPVDYPDVAQALMDYARSAIEADRKQRGELSALIKEAALHLTNWLNMDECECDGPGHWCGRSQVERCRDRLLDAAPQPAESCASPISDKTACGSENGDCDSQPAEPVKRKRRYAQGTALGEFGIIPMCDQVDDEPVAPQPAAPVKSHLKVSYDDKGDCLYVVCDSNEPADAEEDDKGILYRRAISDGRLVGITIMNFMGPHAESRYGKGTP